jgi:hypothetical protein
MIEEIIEKYKEVFNIDPIVQMVEEYQKGRKSPK